MGGLNENLNSTKTDTGEKEGMDLEGHNFKHNIKNKTFLCTGQKFCNLCVRNGSN